VRFAPASSLAKTPGFPLVSVRQELDHQRASFVHPAVFGGDRGNPDPVLQALEGLVVAAPDLGVDR